eukprot:943070-Pelagomonas_calceolata.AAC.4
MEESVCTVTCKQRVLAFKEGMHDHSRQERDETEGYSGHKPTLLTHTLKTAPAHGQTRHSGLAESPQFLLGGPCCLCHSCAASTRSTGMGESARRKEKVAIRQEHGRIKQKSTAGFALGTQESIVGESRGAKAGAWEGQGRHVLNKRELGDYLSGCFALQHTAQILTLLVVGARGVRALAMDRYTSNGEGQAVVAKQETSNGGGHEQ